MEDQGGAPVLGSLRLSRVLWGVVVSLLGVHLVEVIGPVCGQRTLLAYQAAQLIRQQCCCLRAAVPGAGCVLSFTVNCELLHRLATVFRDKVALGTVQGERPPEDQCWPMLWGSL